MASYDEPQNTTDEAKGIYDARDVSRATTGQFRPMYEALRAPIRSFAVEFLYTNNVKPHVVLMLNFVAPFGPGDHIRSVRISMELEEGKIHGHQGPGACQIKLCNYSDRTTRATAGFQFQLRRAIVLGDIIGLINGTFTQLPHNMRSDMRFFEFVDIRGNFDGCHDWIAQLFVRAHAAGVVDWGIGGILGPEGQPMRRESLRPRPNQQVTQIDWHTAGFHNVIGKFFAKPVLIPGSMTPVVYYHDLPIENGRFLSQSFLRFVTDIQQRYRLPYKPPQPNSKAASNNPRAGSGGFGRGTDSPAPGRGVLFGRGLEEGKC